MYFIRSPSFNFTPFFTAEKHHGENHMKTAQTPEVSRETLLSHIRKLMKAAAMCVLL